MYKQKLDTSLLWDASPPSKSPPGCTRMITFVVSSNPELGLHFPLPSLEWGSHSKVNWLISSQSPGFVHRTWNCFESHSFACLDPWTKGWPFYGIAFLYKMEISNYITKMGDKHKGHFKYSRVCLGIGPMWKDLNRCTYAFTSPAHASMPFYFSKALRGSCSPGENSRATMDLQQQWLQGFCYCLCCCSCSCCLFLLFLFFLWFFSVVSVSYDLGCSPTQ